MNPHLRMLLGVVGLVFASSGCFLLDLSTAPPSEPRPRPQPVEPEGYEASIKANYERCSSQTYQPTDRPTAESLGSARQAFATGSDDIPLSPEGCQRMWLSRKDGALVAQAIFGPPYVPALDAVTGGLSYRAAITAWEYAPNKVVMTVDADADGHFELREETVPGVSSVLERREVTGTVLARTTSTIGSNPALVDVVEEELVNGSLVTVSRYTSTAMQRTCKNPVAKPPRPTAGPSGYPPCGDVERGKALDLIQKAMGEQANCLSAAGRGHAANIIVDKVVKTRFEILCTSDPTMVAANNRGYHDLYPDKAEIIINPILFTGVPGYQTATIGHELYHFVERHDPDLEASTEGDQNVLRLVDPVYACEYACFNADATTCHLARCAGKKLGRCKEALDQETINRVEQFRGKPLKACNTGHQVGAICRDMPGNQVGFCTTMAECSQRCGNSQCESKSLSCNSNCR